MQTWILTGGIENFRIYVERGFDVIGMKEGRRRMAEGFEPGDEIILYVSKYSGPPLTGAGKNTSRGQAFAGIVRVSSYMFEDRTPIWPQGKKKKPEAYPWRVEAEPDVVLAEEDFVPAEEMVGRLEHIAKWPADHWHLAFQGQLRVIGEADAKKLRKRIENAARAGVVV
jgi:predicted RNA-binding protein